MRTRFVASLGAAVAMMALALTSVVGQSQAPATLTEQDVYREIGYVPMKDGVELAYVVWRPKQEGRYPTIVSYSPYATNGVPFKDVQLYLEHGYAYVGANIRGTSCSEGQYGLWHELEGPDGAQLIEWAGTQPWSTGSVGMVGISYPGHMQIMTAAQHPSHLKAIVASGLTASSYRDIWMPGGIFNVGMVGWWTFDIQPALTRTAAERRIEWGDDRCAEIRLRQKPNPAWSEVQQHPLLDDWWKARDLETFIGRVDVPALIILGWQDQETVSQGPTLLFNMLKVANKKMILQSGGHGVGGRDINRAQEIRWMDRWLKGENNGIDTEPPVTVLWEVKDEDRDGEFGATQKATPNWTTTYSNWPVPERQRVTLYLTHDGKLSREMPAARADNGVRRYVYPTGTEIIGNNEQFAVTSRPIGLLSYQTEPMAEDTAILGLPQVTFHASSEQKDTDFMVTLHDIDAAGNVLFLQRAVLRASLRAVDTARSNADQIIHRFDKVEELVPGQIYEFKLSLYTLGHVVRQGHRLELSIMAPTSIFQTDWGPLPVSLPSLNKVYHSPQYPSSLMLPIVPDADAQAPPPPCGSLQFQPCRVAQKSTS
jgi:putative CocE/NonD family hydrolase